MSSVSLRRPPLTRDREGELPAAALEVLGEVGYAVARGELPRRPAVAEFLPQMLFHVAASRSLFGESPTDSDHLTRFVDQAILPALRHS